MNVKAAPRFIQSVLNEISDVSMCLNQLQGFLSGTQAASKSQQHLITVDQLLAILANCVLIFSELEEAVDCFKTSGPIHPAKVLIWSRKEQAVSSLLTHLQSSKISLNLMLTTLTW